MHCIAIIGGPCSQHVTGNTSRLNQPQSAIKWAKLHPGCGGHIPRLWSTPQQGLPPMAGLWGRSLRAGGPVACSQRTWGADGWRMDGYHPDTTMVFQFHDCLFHGQDCHRFEDAWLPAIAQGRQEHIESDEDHLKATCGYMLVTI